ncbi:FH6 [Symbiodinium sp. CCMP2456]|nr:FH6 [Symbiodinium sp. CCMP2456]
MPPQRLETQLGNPHGRPAVPLGVEDPVPTEHPKAVEKDGERDEFANLWVNFASKMQASRPGILHGVQASQVLHHLPWAWLRRDLNSLYAVSQETSKFDQFWSHSWKGALWAKYVNVLYLQTGLAANVAGTLSASLALGLVSAGWLGARRGFCLVFGFVTFCFTPFLWRSRRIVFLDIFCIHQQDQQLKAEAIMSVLGSSLGDEIAIWWCVFEIAAFLHSRTKGSKAVLQIIPPLLGPALLGGEILFCLACIVYAYSEIALASSEDSKFSAAIHLVFFGVLGIPCSFFVSHSLRGYARSVETLKEQLCEFKAAGTRSACCEQGHEGEAEKLCDREILFQCIAHWYGSVGQFESQVQSEVRTALTDQLADNAISYKRILLLFTPYVWLRFEYAATHASDPIRQIVEVARTLTYWLAVFPFMNKLLFRLCYRLRAQCCMLRWDVLLSMLIVFATFLFYFICYIIQVFVFRQNEHELVPSVISVVTWLTFTAILLQFDKNLMDAMFTPRSARGAATTPRKSWTGPKPQGLCLLDNSRAHNVAIVLTKLAMSTKELSQAIRLFDTGSTWLRADHVELLTVAMPTTSEATKLLANKDKEETLRDVERRMLPLCNLSPARIKVMKFALSYQTIRESLMERCQVLQQAAEESRNSVPFRELLAIVLEAGNYINGGDQANAQATTDAFHSLMQGFFDSLSEVDRLRYKLPLSQAGNTMQSFVSPTYLELQCLLESLDKLVAKRHPVEVRKQDGDIVEEIARKLRAVMLCCEKWEELFPQLTVDLQPNLMYRIHIFNGEGVDVRLHLFFQDASETYVHSHRANFHSVCLYGSYVNEIWDVGEDRQGDFGGHFEFNRSQDEALKKPGDRKSGSLLCRTCWKHSTGSSYFLDATTYHKTVQESGKALTLYIKGKAKPFHTIALSKEERPDWKGTNCLEERVDPCDVKRISKDASDLLRNGICDRFFLPPI